ncbi:MAG: methionine synthase, partial [Desulfitobacterium hafniense]|nr:methionine synthase [Desulfitobacterium hafniense]
GVKGDIDKLLADKDPKTTELYEMAKQVLFEADEKKVIKANGVYRFFPAQAKGNDVLIFDPNDHTKLVEQFSFPRQSQPPYLCLADYLKPINSGVMDYVGLFAVTSGIGAREIANSLKDEGEYLRSHTIQALALELAEAFAEKLHQAMREKWGYPDPAELKMQDRFAGRYRGIRISLGYPACPNLEDQVKLFRLLNVVEIGINLTDGFMMDPEASVSSIVFAHPEARYFSV